VAGEQFAVGESHRFCCKYFSKLKGTPTQDITKFEIGNNFQHCHFSYIRNMICLVAKELTDSFADPDLEPTLRLFRIRILFGSDHI